MALAPRKKNLTPKQEDPKEAKGSASISTNRKSTPGAARAAARLPKRVPVAVRTIPEVLEKKETVTSHFEPQQYQEMPRELPDNYGDNQIYLLVRDPHWLFAYWEIQKDHQEENLAKLGGNWESVISILRVYDVTNPDRKPPFFDVVLKNMATAWYLNVLPNHSYYVEIGLLHRDGRFISLARSNYVTTPRSGMSEIIDEQWMSVDFDKMYALSGGFQVGKSSAELRKMMEERLKGAISSGSGAGAISSMASPVRIQKRGFFFWLECELIIYGGTEPDAKVTMQGRPVKLRPDGTFTFRYALPDGKFIFDCHAASSDGIEERVITPIVSRNTERPAPVFKTGKKT